MEKSKGARQLAAKGHRQETVAERVGVSRVAVNHWVNATTKPNAVKRELLRDAYGIDPAAWDEVDVKPAKPSAPPTSRAMTPPALRSSGLTSEYLEQVIEECDQLYSEARDSDVSVRDRAGILATKALASTRLGKQRGEDQASMRKFMMTREWRAIEAALERLIEHCSKVAPDACKDFRTALEQIEGDDKGP